MITDVNQLAAALGEPITTDQHRADFNKYIDFLDKRGLAGSADLDKNNLGKNMLARFIKENPGTSLTEDSVIHAQNDMSNQTPETSIIDGLHSSATKNKLPVGDPTAPTFNFGNEGDMVDTKQAANYLQKIGLVGAGQIIESQPDLTNADSIKNSQGDWKIAAIQQILTNASKLGLTKPEEILANKDVLVANPKWRDAINNDSFKNIHPNFWNVITDKLLPEQNLRNIKNTIAKK